MTEKTEMTGMTGDDWGCLQMNGMSGGDWDNWDD